MHSAEKKNQVLLKRNEILKLIRSWQRRGVSDAMITKLLILYCGEPAYMNGLGIYPKENFYDIRVSLHLSNSQRLLTAIKQCGSFGIAGGQEIADMAGFYSPLCHQPEKDGQPCADANKSCEMSNERSYGNNINNNITKGDACADVDFTEEVKAFFHSLNQHPEERTQLLIPLIDEFEKKEKISREESKRCLVCLVNDMLIPYFARRKEFGKTSHEGRICWLRNLLKSPAGSALKNKTAQQVRERRVQQAAEDKLNRKNNRPLSPFEWTDPDTGVRWYDDSLEGALALPPEAAPRPAENAWWDVIDNDWKWEETAK